MLKKLNIKFQWFVLLIVGCVSPSLYAADLPTLPSFQASEVKIDDTSSYSPMTLRYAQLLDDHYEGGVVYGFGENKQWRLRPQVSANFAYDSNIYRERPGDRNEDTIFTLKPGFEFSRAGTRFGFTSGYELGFQNYTTEDDQRTFDQIGKFRAIYAGDRFGIDIKERAHFMKGRAGSELSERRPFFFNDFSAEPLMRIFSGHSISIPYSAKKLSYRDSRTENNYTDHNIGVKLYRHKDPAADMYLHASAQMTRYHDGHFGDSNALNILAAYDKKRTTSLVTDAKGEYHYSSSRLAYFVEGGYKHKKHDKSNVFNTYRNFIGRAVVSYLFAGKTNLLFNFGRNVRESLYQNSGWYEHNYISFNTAHQITEKIIAHLHLGYEYNRYPKNTLEDGIVKKRKDHSTTVGTTIIWKPRELYEFRLGYEFKYRDSNHNTFDDNDHFVYLETIWNPSQASAI